MFFSCGLVIRLTGTGQHAEIDGNGFLMALDRHPFREGVFERGSQLRVERLGREGCGFEVRTECVRFARRRTANGR